MLRGACERLDYVRSLRELILPVGYWTLEYLPGLLNAFEGNAMREIGFTILVCQRCMTGSLILLGTGMHGRVSYLIVSRIHEGSSILLCQECMTESPILLCQGCMTGSPILLLQGCMTVSLIILCQGLSSY